MHPLLIFNEIEKIEIAVRRAVMQIPAEIFNNPFWLTNSEYFLNLSNFRDTMQIIASEYDKSKEEFIQHFKRTYSESFPPSWSNIKYNSVRKRIAKQFQLPIDVFESWLTIIAVTRNACCHHARVWNKQNAIAPTIPNHLPRPWISVSIDRFRIYFNLCIIKYFLNIISPENDMFEKLQDLLGRFPEIDVRAMGFTEGWKEEGVWNSASP